MQASHFALSQTLFADRNGGGRGGNIRRQQGTIECAPVNSTEQLPCQLCVLSNINDIRAFRYGPHAKGVKSTDTKM
jgi:hypothetical protein